MRAKSYVVDVASYQPSNLSGYAKSGAKAAIVKVSQGTNYQNPKGWGQISSAKANQMEVAGYFYATFSGNTSLAILEAQYAIAAAKSMGLPSGAHLAVDWEAGSGNVVTSPASSNTQAILAAMDKIKMAGYKPLLYSGAYVLRNNIHTKQVIARYPNSLWVASYPVSGRIDTANMAYFPSMDGVAIWQFTDNWRGMNVDGNIVVLDSFADKQGDEDMDWHPEVGCMELGRFKVTRPGGAQLYADSKLSTAVGQPLKGVYKVFAARQGAVQAGKDQWFAQSDGITKINTLAVNPGYTGAICKIIADDAYTQNETQPCPGIQHLPKGTTWRVKGRKGKYLIVGSKDAGQYLDGDKSKIILY